jgi:hypothetical protein
MLTQQYNNARSGATLDEDILLDITNIGSGNLENLWTFLC